MNDQDEAMQKNTRDKPHESPNSETPDGEVSPNKDEAEAAGQAVKRGGALNALIILCSLILYVTADRFTPYTTQARVEGYVVGVAPKVSGLVTDVWVKNNQMVDQGARLFAIDPSSYQIAAERARYDVENTRRQISAADAVVAAAQAKLVAATAAELQAQQNANRLAQLYEEDPGTISIRRIEVAQANLKKSQAQVSAAEADIERAIEQMGGYGENNTLLKSAMTRLEQAELDLTNAIVTASTDGIITNLIADVGQFANLGAPVLTLVAINDVWINAAFTENNLGHIREGTAVEILFDALPGKVFHGEIRSIGVAVSGSTETKPGALPSIKNDRDWLRQSQRFPVIISFDPQQDAELRSQLRLGGQASVMAYSGKSSFLTWLGKAYIRLASGLSYAY